MRVSIELNVMLFGNKLINVHRDLIMRELGIHISLAEIPLLLICVFSHRVIKHKDNGVTVRHIEFPFVIWISVCDIKQLHIIT